MTDNFRSYMDHLSHLTHDSDHVASLSHENRSRWADGVVDMCSDDSEDEDCSIDHYSDQETRRSSSRDHAQRNPNFPYESLATPRVAWGERPREAWNDDIRDPHRMFDQTNPYALFNLPHPGLRGTGGFHNHRRRPNVKTEPQPGRQETGHRHREPTHSCRDASHSHREPSHRDVNRHDVIRKRNGSHSQNGGHCHHVHDNSRLCQPNLRNAASQSGCELLQTSQPRFELEETGSSPTNDDLRLNRLPQSTTQEVQDRFIPSTEDLSAPPNGAAGFANNLERGREIQDRFIPSTEELSAPLNGALVFANNLERGRLLELQNSSRQAFPRQLPLSRGVFQPPESTMFCSRPAPLPTCSSQESMDTSDSGGEDCSDVDIVTVGGAQCPVSGAQCPMNGAQCPETGNPHICVGHESRDGRLSRDRSSQIVRPKAVKLENGARQRLDRAISESDDEVIRCPHSNMEGVSSSALNLDSHNRCISPNLGIPLPGLSPSDNDFHSSESRIRHMDTNQNCIAQPPISRFATNANKKSQKDKHNSVIRKVSQQTSPNTVASSIDLTTGESEGGPLGFHGDERGGAMSPVVQDVNLASGSDDSDIEVVKIESSR